MATLPVWKQNAVVDANRKRSCARPSPTPSSTRTDLRADRGPATSIRLRRHLNHPWGSWSTTSSAAARRTTRDIR